jgi:hypothetical protein
LPLGKQRKLKRTARPQMHQPTRRVDTREIALVPITPSEENMQSTTKTDLRAEDGEASHMYPAGYTQRTEPVLFECIGCESTNLCTLAELRKDGWAEYEVPNHDLIVLCDECKATYAERRRIRAALSWSDDDA